MSPVAPFLIFGLIFFVLICFLNLRVREKVSFKRHAQRFEGDSFKKTQSWPFTARDRARAPPHAPHTPHTPCYVEVRDKHSPSKMFTLLRAPGNRTVCKKEELFCFLFLNNSIK